MFSLKVNWDKTVPQEKLYACDNYIDKTEEVEEVACPNLIMQIIEESTSTHNPQSIGKISFRAKGSLNWIITPYYANYFITSSMLLELFFAKFDNLSF